MAKLDYDLIAQWVGESSRLLDLGCGDGELLELLSEQKKVAGIGLEIDENQVASCITRGLQVIHADIESGLGIFRNEFFDYAVLSQTLQEMQSPRKVLLSMLKVSKQAIVSIDNEGHWRKRMAMLFGRAPGGDGVDTSDIRRLVTIADFESLCTSTGLKILNKCYLSKTGRTSLPIFAVGAVYKLGRA